MPDDPIRLRVVRDDGDVNVLGVVRDTRLGGVTRCRAFLRLALNEAADSWRALPDFVGQLAVQFQRGRGVERNSLGDGHRRAVPTLARLGRRKYWSEHQARDNRPDGCSGYHLTTD
jgi:hypothetical protein